MAEAARPQLGLCVRLGGLELRVPLLEQGGRAVLLPDLRVALRLELRISPCVTKCRSLRLEELVARGLGWGLVKVVLG